jgi:hypothetical protein
MLILMLISISLVFQSFERSWNNQLATMIATDDSISAFGDDAHAIPITPDNVLKVLESGTVFGLEITLDNAGHFMSAENVIPGKWEYWFVEFSVKSISGEIQYGINPGVDAQLQYLQDGFYVWVLDEFDQKQCNNDNVLDGFELGEFFHCRFIYLVPADERNLYWVYAMTGTGEDGSYEERYVVFQIR